MQGFRQLNVAEMRRVEGGKSFWGWVKSVVKWVARHIGFDGHSISIKGRWSGNP
jgi:hypothetical protein